MSRLKTLQCKIILNRFLPPLPKNVLAAGLSLQTLSLPLPSGWPMAQRWVWKSFQGSWLSQGICTGLDGSVFHFGDFLFACVGWSDGLSSSHVWLFLLLLGYSIKTYSPSGAGKGKLIYLLRRSLLNFYFQFQASGFFCWIVTAFIHFVVFCILTLQTCYVSSLRRPAMVEFQPWQFCGCWTPASFLWLLLLIPQIIVWAAANRVQG